MGRWETTTHSFGGTSLADRNSIATALSANLAESGRGSSSSADRFRHFRGAVLAPHIRSFPPGIGKFGTGLPEFRSSLAWFLSKLDQSKLRPTLVNVWAVWPKLVQTPNCGQLGSRLLSIGQLLPSLRRRQLNSDTVSGALTDRPAQTFRRHPQVSSNRVACGSYCQIGAEPAFLFTQSVSASAPAWRRARPRPA